MELAKEQEKTFAALQTARNEREAAFAPIRRKVVAEMQRLVSSRQFDSALKYGDPYFDVGDQDFRAAYQKASAGVTAAAELKAKQLNKREGVAIGMTPDQVLASSWGRPEHVNKTTTVAGTSEQWVYPGYRSYLYFVNGVLTAIQN